MAKFSVIMRQACVNTYTATVEAESEEEAVAIAKRGDVDWKFESDGEGGLCHQCADIFSIEGDGEIPDDDATVNIRKLSPAELCEAYNAAFIKSGDLSYENQWTMIGEFLTDLRSLWRPGYKLTHDGMTFTVVNVQDHQTVNVTQDQTGTRMKFHPNEFDEWKETK